MLQKGDCANFWRLLLEDLQRFSICKDLVLWRREKDKYAIANCHNSENERPVID